MDGGASNALVKAILTREHGHGPVQSSSWSARQQVGSGRDGFSHTQYFAGEHELEGEFLAMISPSSAHYSYCGARGRQGSKSG